MIQIAIARKIIIKLIFIVLSDELVLFTVYRSHGIIKLIESGAEIFRLMSEGKDEEEIVRTMREKYEGLDEETAKKAVAAVVERLNEAGLLE